MKKEQPLASQYHDVSPKKNEPSEKLLIGTLVMVKFNKMVLYEVMKT